MRKTFLLAAACALIAAPALAQTGGGAMTPSTTGAANGNAETTGPASAGMTPKTQKFVTDAAMTNMFEIQAAQLAEQKAQNAQDKSFAQKMIEDHQKASDQLQALVEGDKVKAELPTALDSDHQKKMQRLQKLSGMQFDKAYDQMQKAGHKKAVASFRSYAQKGDNPALKEWAQTTLPTLRDHLQMARKLKS